MYKILFLKNEQNDATDYYVQLIKRVLIDKGNLVEIVNDVKFIDKNDKVLTISLKAFLFVWLKNPKQFIIHWFQGVTPEEAKLIHKNIFQKNIRWLYLSFFEKFVLRYSKFNFFVSKAMYEHYKYKYQYLSDNFIIIPCYNQKLNKNAFASEKYEKPTFVYAGSLSDWQCIKETLYVFKRIQNVIADAQLFLYTSEKDKANELILLDNVKNVIVDYIPYEELNQKLEKIKYGFLIRDDILVNQVATPTKMNGYLANGLIPIYSDCINDFKVNLKSGFMISTNDYYEFPDLVIDFEKKKVDVDLIKQEYSNFFHSYYSDDNYIEKLHVVFLKFNVI